MQAELDHGEKNFRRFFLYFNLSWMMISLLSLTFSLVGTFSEHPDYIRNWHGLAILLLCLCIPLTYLTIAFRNPQSKENTSWPPPLSKTLLYSGSLYVVVTSLNLIDNYFIWSYFTVLGISCGFFSGKRLFAITFLIYIHFCYFSGGFAWPIWQSHWDSIAGTGISFFSLVIICLSIQYLIRERHERRQLLVQLTQAHSELAEAHQRLAASAEQEQELAVWRERSRLAREMHDTLGHALVLVSVKLEVARRLRELDPARCDQELASSQELVRSGMNELRATLANLRSPALQHVHAALALRRFAAGMAARAHLQVSYELPETLDALPDAVEETLWKVGQEALANIEKHAQATRITLRLSRETDHILLAIADDGLGLPAELCSRHQEDGQRYQSPAGHYGLSGMHERVASLQGQLSIQTGPDQGTRIEVSLPLPITQLPERTEMRDTVDLSR